VIGINGRGSFEERGRVNVGLGYAISSNQVKHFLPELLATKIAQHGTLDAVFGNRSEGVVCYTMNIDAPIAKAGLALGDRLIAFEGRPIASANDFLNVISTYPAGWPAEVTFEHEGVEKTVHVRLTPLPYVRVARRVGPQEKPPQEEQPEEKPAEEKPNEEKRDEEKPGEQPDQPQRPRLQVERPGLPLEDAGKIRDAELNRAIAHDVVDRWRRNSSPSAAAKALRLVSEIRRDGEVVGKQTLVLTGDGRLRADYEIDGRRIIVACDGQECWTSLPGRDVQVVPRGKAILDPHFAQAAALSLLLEGGKLDAWGQVQLDGADKADRRLCYRLSATDAETTEQLFVWLSVFDHAGQPHVELVKTGVGTDDDEPIASTLYGDWREAAGLLLPHERTLVRGLDESIELSVVTISAEAVDRVEDEQFRTP
jgi:serine protease Do